MFFAWSLIASFLSGVTYTIMVEPDVNFRMLFAPGVLFVMLDVVFIIALIFTPIAYYLFRRKEKKILFLLTSILSIVIPLGLSFIRSYVGIHYFFQIFLLWIISLLLMRLFLPNERDVNRN